MKNDGIGGVLADFRGKQIEAVANFIEGCNVEELKTIIGAIALCHDNLMVFNKSSKSLDRVCGIWVNGGCVQLDVE